MNWGHFSISIRNLHTSNPFNGDVIKFFIALVQSVCGIVNKLGILDMEGFKQI